MRESGKTSNERTSSLRWVKSTYCTHSHCITLKKWVYWHVYSKREKWKDEVDKEWQRSWRVIWALIEIVWLWEVEDKTQTRQVIAVVISNSYDRSNEWRKFLCFDFLFCLKLEWNIVFYSREAALRTWEKYPGQTL